MKTLTLALLLLGLGAVAFAQAPDPRDSVILESKSVLPGVGNPAFTMRVYITNKDSLTACALLLEKRTTTGNADAIIFCSCCGYDWLNSLVSTLQIREVCIPECCLYESNSDTLAPLVLHDPLDPTTIESPNSTRKALFEIKFDSVATYPGTVEMDTIRILDLSSQFFTKQGLRIPVNFVKSVITVMPKGDFNMDGILGLDDVVELINGVFLQEFHPSSVYPFDLNCDGHRSAADVVWELNAVFLSRPFPC